MLTTQYKIILLALGLMATTLTWADSVGQTQQGEFSAEIGLVSKYIYRGGEENDKVAVQGGIEYAHPTGWSVGYWGSTLNYQPKNDKQHGFEHDLYVGYANELNEKWSYSTQLVSYIYQGGGTVYSEDGQDQRRSTGVELFNSLHYQDFSLGLAVMLSDVNYANAGDVYVSAAYSYTLALDFALNTSLGYSLYNKQRDDAVVATLKQHQFTEVRFGLAKALSNTGLSMALDYIWGGQDRYKQDLDEHVVFGLNYSF